MDQYVDHAHRAANIIVNLEKANSKRLLRYICAYFSYIVGVDGDRGRFLLTGIDLDDLLVNSEFHESAFLTTAFKQIACYRLSAECKLDEV